MKRYRTMLNESEIRALVSDQPYQDTDAIKALCFDIEEDNDNGVTTYNKDETIPITIDVKVSTLIDLLSGRGPLTIYNEDKDKIKFMVQYGECVSITNRNIYKG